jgi:hypothetical protein
LFYFITVFALASFCKSAAFSTLLFLFSCFLVLFLSFVIVAIFSLLFCRKHLPVLSFPFIFFYFYCYCHYPTSWSCIYFKSYIDRTAAEEYLLAADPALHARRRQQLYARERRVHFAREQRCYRSGIEACGAAGLAYRPVLASLVLQTNRGCMECSLMGCRSMFSGRMRSFGLPTPTRDFAVSDEQLTCMFTAGSNHAFLALLPRRNPYHRKSNKFLDDPLFFFVVFLFFSLARFGNQQI